MSIPRLNGKGVLPPINGEPYPTTSLELCQRYGTTPERRAVLRGLLDLRAAMRDLQFDGGWQWVAGEFLEDDRLHTKPPTLIKVVSFCKTPDSFKDHEYADQAATIRKRKKTFEKFHVDHLPVLLSWPQEVVAKHTSHHQALLSRQASTGLAVGFLRMDLNTASDDTAALEYLKKMEARA